MSQNRDDSYRTYPLFWNIVPDYFCRPLFTYEFTGRRIEVKIASAFKKACRLLWHTFCRPLRALTKRPTADPTAAAVTTKGL